MNKNKELCIQFLKKKSQCIIYDSFEVISNKTGYSKRQCIRLYQELEKKDIEIIQTHGLQGRPSNHKAHELETKFLLEFIKQYPNCSISQFQDIYHEDIVMNPKCKKIVEENYLKIRSYSFFQNFYQIHKIKTPYLHRVRNQLKNSHPLREPSPCRGTLVMVDGTPHDWFQNGKKFSLHLAIDDSTSEILAGYFMPTECLIGYCHILRQIVINHGIPQILYSDKTTIIVNHINDNPTQFGRMCKELGIEIIAANSPEAKGKVERMNRTIQNRLLTDIKRNNITSYSQLNIFFAKKYIKYINHKFSNQPKSEESEFVPLGDVDLTLIFCIKETRPIHSGAVFSWKGYYYNIIDSNKKIITPYKGTNVTVMEDVFTGKVRVLYKNDIWNTLKTRNTTRNLEKKKQREIDNQKELDYLLEHRDELSK